jgi:putative aminopeptidase FrvX
MRRWMQSLGVIALVAGSALFVSANPLVWPGRPTFPSGPPSPELLSRLPKDVQVDSFGNAWVTRGSGHPHILVLTHRDVPGYVVSQITTDGFLRLQRLGTPLTALFDQFMVGRRVLVYTERGILPAVVACPSTHFRRGPDIPVPEATVDDLWIDIGAESDRDAAAMGVALLDPVVPAQRSTPLATGARAGGFVATQRLSDLVRARLEGAPAGGTITIAFTAGGSEGGRGSRRLLATLPRPDSVVVYETIPAAAADSALRASRDDAWGPVFAPGDTSLAAREAWAQRNGRAAASPAIASADARVWVGAGIPTTIVGFPALYAGTDVELPEPAGSADGGEFGGDPESAGSYWEGYGAEPRRDLDEPPHHATAWAVLRPLLDVYGVSEHERAVADQVRRQLPDGAWADERLDERGNLILALGPGRPERVFVAHLDEIGYRVTSVDPDGRGRVSRVGGFYDWLCEASVVRGSRGPYGVYGAIVPPRIGYRSGPRPPVARPLADELRPAAGLASRFDVTDVRIDPGNGGSRPSPIQVGDDITVIHEIARLGAHRISARAIDDRYGCAALVMAAKELWPERKHLPSTVWFVWSVEEEIGLKGAEWLADSLLHHGMLPKRVHAIDTFVSSDSPLEDQRYGDAKLGQGAVIRAVDTSHETPIEAVRATLALANAQDIPLQYGVTSGGNDGVPFAERGSINVPLAWPLRYSHSAVEVADLRDLESLTRLIVALSRERVSDDPNRP